MKAPLMHDGVLKVISSAMSNFSPSTKTIRSQLQIDDNIAMSIYFNTSSVILEHDVRSHGVLDTSRHLISRMDKSSVLENEDPSSFWVHVESAFLVG